VREEKYAVQKHVAKKSFPIPPVILYDWKGGLVSAYRFSFFPHMVLVDPEGHIAWEGGLTPAADLSRVLASCTVASDGKKP
jgi:hypothetical protein